jgi:hypothetical protein
MIRDVIAGDEDVSLMKPSRLMKEGSITHLLATTAALEAKYI